tara:strand:- start:122829 stop:124547 length:1719 start_codon:yes stop_codon:yes gene_type:complete
LKFNQTLTDEYKNDNLEKINTVCSQSVSYHLPLRIVVHRDIDNNTFITNRTIEELLEETNLRLLQSGTDVRFYLIRSPVYINNSEFANGDLINAQELEMFVAQHNSNQFTMHLVDDGGGSAEPPNLPFNSNSWVGSQDVDIGAVTQARLERVAGTMAHELGHNLGLEHTHKAGRLGSEVFNGDNANVWRKCLQESVTRRTTNFWYKGCTSTDQMQKCEVNGDFLCDTQADPNMGNAGDVTYNDNPNSSDGDIAPCDYRLPEEGVYRMDRRDDLWTPHARNVMAYGNRRCRNFFSTGQKGIMYDNASSTFSDNVTNIVGSNSISCTSNRGYSIRGIWGATYTWTVSSGLRIMSGQGTSSLSLRGKAGYSNNQIVSLNVSKPYGNYCFNKNINLTSPSNSGYISGQLSMVSGGQGNFYAVGFGSGVSYNWGVSGSGWSIISESGNYARIKAGSNSGIVSVTASNACGNNYKYKNVIVGGGSDCDNIPYAISPNPTSDYMTLAPIEPPCPIRLISSEKPTAAYQYSIFNKYGKRIMSSDFEEKVDIDLRSLKKDYYKLVLIKNGKVILQESFIKE